MQILVEFNCHAKNPSFDGFFPSLPHSNAVYRQSSTGITILVSDWVEPQKQLFSNFVHIRIPGEFVKMQAGALHLQNFKSSSVGEGPGICLSNNSPSDADASVVQKQWL